MGWLEACVRARRAIFGRGWRATEKSLRQLPDSLWIDRPGAGELLNRRRASAGLGAGERALLDDLRRNGYAILPSAVSAAAIDRLLEDVERLWSDPARGVHYEYFPDQRMAVVPARPELRERQGKLIDIHGASAAAREVLFAEPIRRLLELLFDGPPLAFQSLYFERGTQQPMHRDTSFVGVVPSAHFAAAWIALEDIEERSGELEYYEGSQHVPDYLFDDRQVLVPASRPIEPEYNAWWPEHCERLGLARRKFRPRKGDVLIWSSRLVHGGSADVAPGRTRRSLVVHYCPLDAEPIYFQQAPHTKKHRHRPGCWHCQIVRNQQPG